MKTVYLNNKPVRIDEDDYFCLTDIWRANGLGEDKKPWRFLKLASTKKLVVEVENDTEFQGSSGDDCNLLKVIKIIGKETFAHRHMTYDYVGWIDARFKHQMYKILDDYYNGNITRQPYWRQNNFIRKFTTQYDKASWCGSQLSIHKRIRDELVEEGKKILDETQLIIEFKT